VLAGSGLTSAYEQRAPMLPRARRDREESCKHRLAKELNLYVI